MDGDLAGRDRFSHCKISWYGFCPELRVQGMDTPGKLNEIGNVIPELINDADSHTHHRNRSTHSSSV
ncbi:hypothetical protein D3C77_303020 [compost metagenome]